VSAPRAAPLQGEGDDGLCDASPHTAITPSPGDPLLSILCTAGAILREAIFVMDWL